MSVKKGVTGIAITVLAGFGAHQLGSEKQGIVWHDIGVTVSVETVDTYEEAKVRANNVCQYTHDHVGKNGCSYHKLIIGDWLFEGQELDSALSYHCKGFNAIAYGWAYVITDDRSFNRRTFNTAKLLLKEYMTKHDGELDFSIFHRHGDPKRRRDPEAPFDEWMMEEYMVWDSRPYLRRIKELPTMSIRSWVSK